jgi:D-galactarolactone isomerase
MRDALPQGATDTHMQVYGLGCSASPGRGAVRASVADCRDAMARTGFSRAVIVQPESCGTDNACLLAALAALGPAARGVAMLSDTVSDRDLDLLSAQGVAGMRCIIHEDADPPQAWAQVAARVAEHGWHVDFACDANSLPEREVWLRRLPGTLVIDTGRSGYSRQAPDSAVCAVVSRLLETGRVWIKLSGPDQALEAGAPKALGVAPVVRRMIARAPDRCVWGSNWPHADPDPAVIAAWMPDEAIRDRVLRENPAALYGFGPG